MLRACRARIQRQCATLARLAAHLRSDGLTDSARRAAIDVHRYFSSAGRQHYATDEPMDGRGRPCRERAVEEQDLFPRLRTEPVLAVLLDTLAREHAAREALWQRLEPLLAAPDTIHDLDAFAQLADEFNALYAQHIARENSELLPQAERLLSIEQQHDLGARMAARRGVSLRATAEAAPGSWRAPRGSPSPCAARLHRRRGACRDSPGNRPPHWPIQQHSVLADRRRVPVPCG